MPTDLHAPWLPTGLLAQGPDLSEGFKVRCLDYCTGVAGREALMEHPPERAIDGPHDNADEDPLTRHYVVKRPVGGSDVQTVVGSLRLLNGVEQAAAFWEPFADLRIPPGINGYREISRVSKHPEFFGSRADLFRLFGVACEESISEGYPIWIATMRATIVRTLIDCGIPIVLLNSGQRVTYEATPGVTMPTSMEPLYVCMIFLERDVLPAIWMQQGTIDETGLTAFQLVTPWRAANGWRPNERGILMGQRSLKRNLSTRQSMLEEQIAHLRSRRP